MRDQHKLPTAKDPVQNVVRSQAANAMKDPASAQLRTQAAKQGNDAHATQVSGADQQRDTMLQFIAHRLATAQVLQQRELDQIAKSRVWYDEVARGKGSFKLPDPTRWRNCANLYQRAIQALTAGHLGRGCQLLDQAVEAEKAVHHSLPAQVKQDDWHAAPNGPPEERLGIGVGASSGTVHAQEMLDLSREIANVTAHAENVPQPQYRKPHHGWWGAGAGDQPAGAEKPAAAEHHEAKKAAPAKPAAAKAAPAKPAPAKAAPTKPAPAKAVPAKVAPEKSPAKAAPHVDTHDAHAKATPHTHDDHAKAAPHADAHAKAAPHVEPHHAAAVKAAPLAHDAAQPAHDKSKPAHDTAKAAHPAVTAPGKGPVPAKPTANPTPHDVKATHPAPDPHHAKPAHDAHVKPTAAPKPHTDAQAQKATEDAHKEATVRRLTAHLPARKPAAKTKAPGHK